MLRSYRKENMPSEADSVNRTSTATPDQPAQSPGKNDIFLQRKVCADPYMYKIKRFYKLTFEERRMLATFCERVYSECLKDEQISFFGQLYRSVPGTNDTLSQPFRMKACRSMEPISKDKRKALLSSILEMACRADFEFHEGNSTTHMRVNEAIVFSESEIA